MEESTTESISENYMSSLRLVLLICELDINFIEQPHRFDPDVTQHTKQRSESIDCIVPLTDRVFL